MRLRTAVEIQHMAVFFRTNAYFQIKSNKEMTNPDSDEFHALGKLETDGYEDAKRLRRSILQEVSLFNLSLVGMKSRAVSSFLRILLDDDFFRTCLELCPKSVERLGDHLTNSHRRTLTNRISS